jgi:serine/threonine protein phosphatase PrpC
VARGFTVAGGSVAGRHHVRAGRNNQDAFAWRRTEGALVAVVCDGCSSGAHSEVGARIGARLLAQSSMVQQTALAELARLAQAMCGAGPGTAEFAAVVADYFLFTAVGVVIEGDRARAITLGDGLIAVNGVATRLGPFPGNAPPYLGYSLLGREVALETTPLPAASETASIVLATDGAQDIELKPFTTDPRVQENPDMVRRLLWQQARARQLDDDATLVVIRPEAEEGAP